MNKKTLIALLVLINLLAVYSCKKVNNPFGKDQYDPDMLLDASGIDTFSIIAYSELLDSTFTRNARLALLGAYNDPDFGDVRTGFNTQLRLVAAPNFGDLSSINIDSVVIALEYRDQYGIGRVPQKFGVYRLSEALTTDSNYASVSTTQFINEQLIDEGFATLTPDPLKRTVVGADTLSPQLRLRLKNSLGQELINSSANGHMVDNDAFLTYFKGLRIVVEDEMISPSSGAVYSFDLLDRDSKMTIYYNQNGASKTFDLLLNERCVYYNMMKYETQGLPLQIIQNPSLGNNAFYAQTGNIRAVVRFPGVLNLGSRTVIHRAILTLPYVYFNGDDRYPSEHLVAFNRRGDEDAPWGLTVNSSGILSPTLHRFVPQFKHYSIDITSFVQGLIKESPSFSIPELIISGSRTNDNVERIIFNGVQSTNKFKPRLLINYTEF